MTVLNGRQLKINCVKYIPGQSKYDFHYKLGDNTKGGDFFGTGVQEINLEKYMLENNLNNLNDVIDFLTVELAGRFNARPLSRSEFII